ncbi:DoxX family protein [Zhouia amylolytica]|uniref:DoxX family protein n=1 Tax=Zhouia amylolytica TaxID=376730 RepID=UPI0020CE33BA|nr:DoxX family protein [Zhouia amylolytica]MCQ0111212.1 DoxX family protein [Zhouia amylolytica]
MNTLTTFEQFYLKIKSNRWYWLFSIFCRVSLAFAFIAAGMVKIVDERFASGLSVVHPMGAYLEALHHTGYYDTFIGVVQVLAAVLLLIPRTVALGALLYFPIILNIWVLSYAVRFDGSFVTSPLMVLANLFLLVWNYDRLKYLLPFKQFSGIGMFEKPKKYSLKFPWMFFAVVLMTVFSVIAFAQFGHEVMPRNSLSDCQRQFKGIVNEKAGFKFCECIHMNGTPLDDCLEEFERAKQ